MHSLLETSATYGGSEGNFSNFASASPLDVGHAYCSWCLILIFLKYIGMTIPYEICEVNSMALGRGIIDKYIFLKKQLECVIACYLVKDEYLDLRNLTKHLGFRQSPTQTSLYRSRQEA